MNPSPNTNLIRALTSYNGWLELSDMLKYVDSARVTESSHCQMPVLPSAS